MLNVLSILANAAILVILNVPFYTDRMPMPDGETRVWHRSPFDRLQMADNGFLLYLQLALAAVSVISAVLALCGVGGETMKKVRTASLIASAVLFAAILIVTANTHVKYA